MKQNSLIFLSCTLLLLSVTSCLKDKGFEDQKYGIQGNEIKAVSFPQSSKDAIVSGSINSQVTESIIQGPLIALEDNGHATTDVTVTVELNNTLINAVNTDQDLELEPVPADKYTLTPLTVVVAAGQNISDAIKITIPNSTLLDPTVSYALGFTISTADQGYIIPENQKNIVIAFSIKNKYDGIYSLRLKSTGWAAYGIADGVSGAAAGTYGIVTTGANTNSIFSNLREDGLLPALTGTLTSVTGTTAFGATTPQFVFDNATNKLTDVVNTTPDDTRGRKLELNPAVTDSRYDPDKKIIYASFIMKQNARPNQIFYDTLTFIKER